MKTGAWSIKGSLVNNGRCPKCTLKPPCKHYEKVEDLPTIQPKQKARPQPKALPPIPPPTGAEQAFSPPTVAEKRTDQAY